MPILLYFAVLGGFRITDLSDDLSPVVVCTSKHTHRHTLTQSKLIFHVIEIAYLFLSGVATNIFCLIVQ